MARGIKPKRNDKQIAFCREYVKDYNGTQAAIRAGYSKKTAQEQSSQLLSKLIIQEEILKRERQFENRVGINKEKILRELALIGFSSMDDYVDIDENGIVIAKCFDQMQAGAVRAIKKIREKRVIRTEKGTKDKPDGEEILDSTFEFELYDKPMALINMGKELGMFKERREISGPNGEPLPSTTIILSPMEAAARVAHLFQIAIERKKVEEIEHKPNES